MGWAIGRWMLSLFPSQFLAPRRAGLCTNLSDLNFHMIQKGRWHLPLGFNKAVLYNGNITPSKHRICGGSRVSCTHRLGYRGKTPACFMKCCRRLWDQKCWSFVERSFIFKNYRNRINTAAIYTRHSLHNASDCQGAEFLACTYPGKGRLLPDEPIQRTREQNNSPGR